MEAKDRIIVALDVDSLEKAKPLVTDLAPYVGCFKVGLELLTSEGAPRVVKCIHTLGGKVFFDGKFDDIPNTIVGASKAAAMMGVWMFNVHASSGIDGMMEAVANKGESLVFAVSVLTSIDTENSELVFGASVRAKVLQFARDAKLAGVDGLICSPQELATLVPRREKDGKKKELFGMQFATPGVRPEWAAANDQKRAMTPGEAIKAGADFLVIGRPITAPPEGIGGPVDAVKRIYDEIAANL